MPAMVAQRKHSVLAAVACGLWASGSVVVVHDGMPGAFVSASHSSRPMLSTMAPTKPRDVAVAGLHGSSKSPSEEVSPVSPNWAVMFSMAAAMGLTAAIVTPSAANAEVSPEQKQAAAVKWVDGVKKINAEREATDLNIANKWKETTSVVIASYDKEVDALAAKVQGEAEKIKQQKKSDLEAYKANQKLTFAALDFAGDKKANDAMQDLVATKKQAEESSEAKRSAAILKANEERDSAFKAAEDKHEGDLKKNEADKQAASK